MRLHHLIFLAVLLQPACGEPPAQGMPAVPATISHAVKEAELTTITLSPEAERRLGIVTVVAERRAVQRTRTVGGEVIVRPGGHAMIAAPRAGTVLRPTDRPMPEAGSRLTVGAPMVRLLLLPAESDLFQAGDETEIARARLVNARSRAERAEELLKDAAGTVEAAEDARQVLAEAEASFRAATSRVSVLEGGSDTLGLRSVMLEAPFDGVVQQVSVAPGQRVAAGTALIELAALDPLWIRVPLFPGDLTEAEPSRGATVARVGGGAGAAWRRARSVRGPQSADPVAASVDLYFEVGNADGALRPGERVAVTLSLRGDGEGLVVPWGAVVRDISGGAWVYEHLGEGRYARRRVEVVHVSGEDAVLARGIGPGTWVVAVGAAELFSTEFGPAK